MKRLPSPLFSLPLLVPALLVAACASTPSASVVAPQESKPPAPKDDVAGEPSPGFRLPKDTRPVDYALHFDLDPAKESFNGTAKITVKLDNARRSIWLHARNLNVSAARINGAAASFKQVDDDGMARVSLDKAVGPGEVVVELEWSAKYNDSLESVYRVQFEGAWYVFTQFEAIMARESFPCFDEPGFKAPFTLSFTTKKGDVVFANTDVASSGAIEGERTRTTFAKTQPLPTYLLAWAVGPLEVVEHNVKVGGTRIRGITAKGKLKELGISLDIHAKALASLEKYFGIPYPYGKLDFVAVPDFAAGAMENAGLVTYRDALLFIDADSPIGMQKANAHVIAHELAHQWFGNLVTLAWWDDIWLNEAFASWAQTFVVNEIRPELNAKVDARGSADWVMGEDSLVSARQIRQPVLSKGDIINAFDGITYTKGAAAIAMFESYVGAAKFQEGVRAYLQEHAHGTATSSELMKALGKASGQDVGTAFNTFLEQPGVPFVQAKLNCTSSANTLELTQSRWLPVGSTGDTKKTWHVPVCARAGKDTTCTLLTAATGSIALPGKTCPKLVVPNADGVGYFRWSLPADQLKQVAAQLKTLTPGERISFANAVRAGAWAGSLLFADALAAAQPLARDSEATVARTPLGFYTFAWSELVEHEARPKVMKALADTYRPVLDEVKLMPPKNKGKSEDPRVRERRTLAVGALVIAEDKRVTAELAKLGDKALAGGKVNLDAVPGDLAGQAIAASIKAGGAKKWDEAANLLSSETDSLARGYLLGGLGGVEDPALSKKALALSLDPRLKVNEVTSPIWSQISDPRTREAAWAWTRENIDAILARLPESATGEMMPGLVGGACSVEAAADLEKFVREKSKGKELPGLERALAQQTENMRLCAAKKQVHEESARKLFPK